ncbi:MAG TPA: peptidylprolyl isomerase [Acidimicrobiia bacterium]
MKKLLVSLVALVTVLAAAGCDSASGPALTVNGTDVSRSSVEREFEALADNEVLAEQAQVAGAGDETLNADVAAFWLTLLVQQEVIDDEVRENDIEVTDADRQEAQTAIDNEIGREAYDAFPDWFQDRIAGRYARRVAFLRATGGAEAGPTDEQVRAEFDRALTEIKAQCPSGKFAAHILVATVEEANAIVAELAAGADFAELARTRSIDTTSAQAGGELLQCFDVSQYVPEFATAADALALGAISAPVQSEFGFHVIRMSDTIPFEAVEEQVRQSLEPSGTTSPELETLVADATVRVDPRYGTWEVVEGQGLVVPPETSEPASTTAPAPAPAP